MALNRTALPLRDILLVVFTLVAVLVSQALYFLPHLRWTFVLISAGAIITVATGLMLSAIWDAVQDRQARRAAAARATPAAPTPGTMPAAFLPSSARHAWMLRTLRSLEWRRFEELVCAYVRVLGYDSRQLRRGPDGSADLLVVDGSGRPLLLVHCRSWSVFQVGHRAVQELRDAMTAHGITNGAYFTAGSFSDEAKALGQRLDLDLVDGDELLSRFHQLPPAQVLDLLYHVTRGDYTTPSCPSCGSKMLLRAATMTPASGEEFWMCRSYPSCRHTFKAQAT